MKIGLIAPTSIPAKSANTIQVMKNAVALTAIGHSVQLYIPGISTNQTWENLATHYGLVATKPDSLNLIWISKNSSLKSYDYGLKAVRMARNDGVDCIFTRLLQAAALSTSFGFPTYYEAHDIPTGQMGPILFNQFLRGKASKNLISISQALLDDLNDVYKISDSVAQMIAPDGVDLERFDNLPSKKDVRTQLGMEDTFTAGYTGHLYEGRGEELILGLAERMSEIKFLVIGGKDKDIDRVQEKIDQNDLKNVQLVGFVPNAKLPLYQHACDCLLMPYQDKIAGSSGGDIVKYLSPMKMFEYLASGKPILSSDLAVLREVLNEENALLLPSTNIDAWEQAILKILNNEEFAKQLGDHAKTTAQIYSWEKRVRSIFGNGVL